MGLISKFFDAIVQWKVNLITKAMFKNAPEFEKSVKSAKQANKDLEAILRKKYPDM